jgi:cyanoexosortase A
VGLSLLGIIVVRSLLTFSFETLFIRGLPLGLFLSLTLVASGFTGLRYYWREIVILATIAFPTEGIFLESYFPINEWTATIAAFVLHYAGFEVTHQGTSVILPTGSVRVLYQCTGGPIAIQMLQLMLIFILTFPLRLKHKVIGLLGAITIGFLAGSIRSAWLALVVHDKRAFEYWHGSEGSGIAAMAAMVVLGGLCYWLLEDADAMALEEAEWLKQEQENSQDTQRDPVETLPLSVSSHPSQLSSQLRVTGITLSRILGTAVALTLASFYAIVSPTAGNRRVAPFQFPQTLSFSGGQQQSSQPLLVFPEVNYSEFLLATLQGGQEYSLQYQNTPLKLQVRYLIGSRGNVPAILSRLGVSSGRREREVGNYIKEGEIPEIGHYQLVGIRDRLYLTTCLNPRGKTTVTQDQFLSNRYRLDWHWSRIPGLISGYLPLRDQRCLWVMLSVPLQGSDVDTAGTLLVEAWKALYPQWHPFPAL